MELLAWVKTLHTSAGISEIIATGGWIALVVIIFAETGLLVGFFLPGDSLLITAGVLSNTLNPNHIPGLEPVFLNIVLVIAAILGDQTGYYLGLRTGPAIWNRPYSKLFKRKHLLAAQEFYKKYGGPSVVAARYVPIVRTFVPFLAGVARMPYRRFVFWNVLGGVLWITSLIWLGFYLGQTGFANRLDKLIVVVIGISLLPMIIGALKARFMKKSA